MTRIVAHCLWWLAAIVVGVLALGGVLIVVMALRPLEWDDMALGAVFALPALAGLAALWKFRPRPA